MTGFRTVPALIGVLALLSTACAETGLDGADIDGAFEEARANKLAFADMNNNGTFDEGVDLRIYDIIFSDANGLPAGFFDTTQAKGAYQPPADPSQRVGVVIPALDNGKASVVKANGYLFYLAATGDIRIDAHIAVGSRASLTTITAFGQLLIEPGVRLKSSGDGYVQLNGEQGIEVGSGSQIQASRGNLQITANSGAITLEDDIYVRGKYSVDVHGQYVDLGNGARFSSGRGECVNCLNDGSTHITGVLGVVGRDSELKGSAVKYFNPEEDDWMIVMNAPEGGIRLQDCEFNGYADFSAMQRVELTTSTFTSTPRVR